MRPYWKVVAAFMFMSFLLNCLFLCTVLTHFNTFNGAPLAEKLANIFMYAANWPAFLLHKYPYVIAGGGETVYEALGWIQPLILIINLTGWGMVGFVMAYLGRKRK